MDASELDTAGTSVESATSKRETHDDNECEKQIEEPDHSGRRQQIAGIVRDFHTYLKSRNNGELGGSITVAKKTVVVIRDVVTHVRWAHASELISTLKIAGSLLKTGVPTESLVDNIFRRVLLLIREAYLECVSDYRNPGGSDLAKHQPSIATSLQGLLVGRETFDFDHPFKQLKGMIMNALNDLVDEIEESTHNIATQAIEHIHSAEVIMTLGHSSTVEQFLMKAASKRNFHVIVAEAAPSLQGHTLAMRLGAAGIETTLITDSACFALMSRVNKVIIGTHLITADGGLMALSGCHALALAAKHHSVPVIVCSAMYKLSPKYPCAYDQDDFNHIYSPNAIMGYENANVVGKATIVSPLFDYVPPDLISLFVSNIGSNAPSYIYRLLSEYYYTDNE